MTNEILQLAFNSSGAALVCVMFLLYLRERSKLDAKERGEFRATIERITDKFDNNMKEHSKKIQELSSVITQLYDYSYKQYVKKKLPQKKS